ncbi:MAG: cytochrome c biogenesis protein CcdA [Bacteroidetes bacterium]|nr:cytochrome c biogenesis protein CcdA [Bacteroidota bacterium]
MLSENINILTAFVFGLLSFISPCVLPIIPGYISFISGKSLQDITQQDSAARKAILINTIIFIAGFTLIFVLMGAAATSIGKVLNENLSLISKIAGVIIIIFGFHMIGIFKLGFLNYEKRFHLQEKKLGYFGSFTVGAAFAFGWTPCIGPVLAGILAIASQQDTVMKGIILLTFYSLGLGIPFFLTSLSINKFFNVFNRIKKHFHTIEVVGGILLVAVGVLMITNYLTIIASYFAKWFPFLNELS